MYTIKQQKPQQSRVIQSRKNISNVLMAKRKKKNSVNNSWSYIATSDFIKKHVGNSSYAERIAKEREIPICHVLDSSNINALCKEVGLRVYNGEHGPKSTNPLTGNQQYYTNSEYLIYQIKYTKGKTKSIKSMHRKFFYDAPTKLIHHFDGIKNT